MAVTFRQRVVKVKAHNAEIHLTSTKKQLIQVETIAVYRADIMWVWFIVTFAVKWLLEKPALMGAITVKLGRIRT